MADVQFGELAAMSRIDRFKALGVTAAFIRAYTDKFIAKGLKQVAKRWGRRFLEEALFLKSYAANKNLWLTDPLWPVKNDNNKGNFKDMGDKSKPALSQVTPQARYHFTRFDQADQLVVASETKPDIGYMGRLLSLCSLPRTNPGNRPQYKRVNGPYKLIIIAGGDNKLPFGHIPRLLLAWVCTETVRTQGRDLLLGDSLSDFMRVVGIEPAGASFARVRNQMNRLFRCQISLIYTDKRGSSSVSSLIADCSEFWWTERSSNDPAVWKSSIRLGEEFFNEVIRHPIPLNLHILKALRRSSIGLDLYQWINYRTFGLQRPVQLTWRQLYRQFGVDPANANDRYVVRNFRTKCLRELHKIKAAWPGLDYKTPKGALELLPTTTPSVPPLQATLLTR